MVKTQIQLPDELYQEAKRVAREREISFAEVVRRGVDYITRVYPPVGDRKTGWSPPAPRRLGAFLAPVESWRELAQDERAG
jgi:hypothetical protein